MTSIITSLQTYMNQKVDVGSLLVALLEHTKKYELREKAKDILHLVIEQIKSEDALDQLQGLTYMLLALDAFGDTSNQYIAEIVPALSLILEGDDDATEDFARQCLKKMEELTGEDMQAYL